MTIERQYGEITIICDGCGECFETETADFNNAITSFKAEGGKISKDGDQWQHWCGDPCEPGDE